MSYEVHGEGGLAARLKAIPTAWKIVLGAGALLWIASAMGGGDGSALPPGVRPGVRLTGLQMQGEKAMYHEQGLVVTDVSGDWIEIRFGDDDATRRWFHARYVAGLKIQPE